MLHVKNEKKIPYLIKGCSCHVGLHEMTHHDKHKNPKCHIYIYSQFMCPIEALLTCVFLGMIDNHFAYWFHFW
jgi:hypothetical protein